MTKLDFNLVNIIKNAVGDPGDVTDAVWNAGYRKIDFTTEQIIKMTTEQIGFCVSCGIPQDVWPTTVEDLSYGNLNTIIDDALWSGTPAEIATAILKSGYVKGGDK